jgi:hypothetical protein
VLATITFPPSLAEKMKECIQRECEELAGLPCKVATRYDPYWRVLY